MCYYYSPMLLLLLGRLLLRIPFTGLVCGLRCCQEMDVFVSHQMSSSQSIVCIPVLATLADRGGLWVICGYALVVKNSICSWLFINYLHSRVMSPSTALIFYLSHQLASSESLLLLLYARNQPTTTTGCTANPLSLLVLLP